MVKKLAICLLLISIFVCILTGCSNQITQGEVVGKEFKEAHTQIMMIPIIHSNGKTTSTQIIPYIYYYPDTWKITIQKWDEDNKEMLQATWRVTKDVYDVVNIGDEFVYEDDMQPEEPEYTRERQE